VSGFEIIDDAYTSADCEFLFGFAKNSFFRFGWTEDHWSDVNGQERILYSNLSDEDVDNAGLLKPPMLKSDRLIELIAGRDCKQAVINLADPSNCFCPHTHIDRDVMVYYMNTRWNAEWAGETIIYNDYGGEAEYAVSFKPARVLWLKAGVRHSLRPPSIAAPEMRFTFAAMFEKV
jgi:hypothetical protein